MRPLNLVAGEGFQALMQYLEPGYVLPGRTFFTSYLEKRHDDLMSKLGDQLSNIEHASLTTDIWTSIRMEAYMSVTIHFVTDDWKLERYVLATLPLEERHTGENIAKWILRVLEKFSIDPSKIRALVTDNGSNMLAAAKKLYDEHQWVPIKCSAHSLQLSVNAGLNGKTISRAVGAARSLVEHFKKSVHATTALKAKQVQMSTPKNKLIQDVSTRWNSTLHMIQRLLEQRWPVSAVLSDNTITDKSKGYLDLKSEQWDTLADLQSLLQLFESATTFFSGDQYVSLSGVVPVIKGLILALRHKQDDSPSVSEYKNVTRKQLTDRYDVDTMPEDHSFIATALKASAMDPRFSHLRFVDDATATEIKRMLHKEIGNTGRECSNKTPATTSDSDPVLDSLFGHFEESDSTTGNSNVEAIFDNYFSEKNAT